MPTSLSSSGRRDPAASFLLFIALSSVATVAVSQDNAEVEASHGFVAAEERLALAQEAVEIADMTSGAKKVGSTGSTVDSKYPPCPPSPPRGEAPQHARRIFNPAAPADFASAHD